MRRPGREAGANGEQRQWPHPPLSMAMNLPREGSQGEGNKVI